MSKLINTDSDYSLWINRALNLTYLGRLNESMESHQKALDLIDDILKKDPKNIDAWKNAVKAKAFTFAKPSDKKNIKLETPRWAFGVSNIEAKESLWVKK